MNRNLLNTKQAAQILGVSAAFLERDRWAGAKVPFIRLGARSVRYRQSDIDTYIASKVMSSTSEYQQPGQLAHA